MAQWVERWLYMHEDLSMIPGAQVKKARCGGARLKPQHWGGEDRWIPESCWPASLSYSGEPQDRKTLLQKQDAARDVLSG